jgi:toxin ParE1/3/4
MAWVEPMAIHLRPRARLDLDTHFVDIGALNRSAAIRFLAGAERTLDLLSALPLLGGAFQVQNPRLPGLRHFLVHGFRKFVVFYLPLDDGIEVVRVLYGGRDVEAILEAE